jgi:hypothetical protein
MRKLRCGPWPEADERGEDQDASFLGYSACGLLVCGSSFRSQDVRCHFGMDAESVKCNVARIPSLNGTVVLSF